MPQLWHASDDRRQLEKTKSIAELQPARTFLFNEKRSNEGDAFSALYHLANGAESSSITVSRLLTTKFQKLYRRDVG